MLYLTGFNESSLPHYLSSVIWSRASYSSTQMQKPLYTVLKIHIPQFFLEVHFLTVLYTASLIFIAGVEFIFQGLHTEKLNVLQFSLLLHLLVVRIHCTFIDAVHFMQRQLSCWRFSCCIVCFTVIPIFFLYEKPM